MKREHSFRPLLPTTIFGKNGPMRGIPLGSPESNASSFRINKKFKRNASVWPYRSERRSVVALPDLHPPRRRPRLPAAGIFSSRQSGAYSIVLSGKYSSLDKDRGELITYSDSKALDNNNQRRPVYSNSTLAMKRSFKEEKPIRVVRGSRTKGSPWAVACGFRYDGLYTIIGEKERTNKAGGVYLCWNCSEMVTNRRLI